MASRDAPNTWAPHQYIILQALRALPANISSGSPPSLQNGQSSWDLIPSGQLGMDENQLPQQPSNTGNITNTGPDADINAGNGTVVNGGNATSGEGWSDMLQREVANRYITSAFCSWYVVDSPSGRRSSDDIHVGWQRAVLSMA